VSQKVPEAAQRTVAGAGAAGRPEQRQRPAQRQTLEQRQRPEQTQTPQTTRTQEVSRKASLEVQRPEEESSEVGLRMSLEASSEVSRKVRLEVRRFPR
jgi:hypothetical protein